MNHTWIIYTYGNLDTLYNILMSTGALFGGGAVNSMIKLAAATAILVVLTQITGAISTGQAGRPFEFAFFFRFYLLYAMFVMIPAGNIVLMDEMTGQPKVIATSSTNRIPLGVAAINSFSSVVAHGFITIYEQYFMTGSSGNVALSYSKSGMAFGSNFIAGLPTMTTGDVEFENNLKNYFANCGLPLAYSQGAMNALASQSDILGFFSNNFADVQRNRWVSQVSGGTMTTTTCADAIKNLNTTWNTNNQQYLAHVSHMVGFPNSITSNFITAANMTSNDLLQVSSGASDALKQAIAMNMIFKSIYTNASQVDNASLANAAYDAQQYQQYQAGGMMSNQQAARVVPALKIFAEAMLFMLYPLMVFYALITTNLGVVIKYIKWSMTIATIPLVYEIISALIYWYSSNKTGGIISEGGFNLMTASGLYDLNSSIAATANWLSMSTPILAYAIVSGSDNAITSVFGHATDPAKSVSASSGDQFSKGNLGMGNVSLDNAGMNTVSANKFNNAMDMMSGSPQINDRFNRSTVSNYADGSSTVQSTVSSGAITDTTNSALSQQLSQAYSKAETATQQAGTDLSNAYRAAGQYAEGHGLSWSGGHDKSSGVDISNATSKSSGNNTVDNGGVGAGLNVGAGAKGGGGGSPNANAGFDLNMKAGHNNATNSGYDTKQNTVTNDTNNWKQSDLYKKDSAFKSMVDATETAQHRYSDSMAKSQALQEQLQTAQQTAVSQSVNTNDAAWKQALDRNNGNTQAALQEYNSVAGRQQHFAEQKQDTFGQTGIESHLGVTPQAEKQFRESFNHKFQGQAQAAGNNAEAHVKENIGKGEGVIKQSEQGLSDAREMTKGSKVSTVDHSTADQFNYLPDTVNIVQNNARKAAEKGIKEGDSGYPTISKDKDK